MPLLPDVRLPCVVFLLGSLVAATASAGESSIPRVFLGASEQHLADTGSHLFGNRGLEVVTLGDARGVVADGNVEQFVFSGESSQYSISAQGTKIAISDQAGPVLTLQGLNQPATLTFTDTSATLVLNGLLQASLGEQAVTTQPSPIDLTGNRSGNCPCSASSDQKSWVCDFSSASSGVEIRFDQDEMGALNAEGTVGDETFSCTFTTFPDEIALTGSPQNDTFIARNLAKSAANTLSLKLNAGSGNDTLCLLDNSTGEVDMGQGDDRLYLSGALTSVPGIMTGGDGNNQCNSGPGTAWATECSYSPAVPQVCASAGVYQTALFYQVVGIPDSDPVQNGVRSGLTTDGFTVSEPSPYWMKWNPINTAASTEPVFGDPNFSQLEDGTWLMAARGSLLGASDPKDRHDFLSQASTCPAVTNPVALQSSTVEGCEHGGENLINGKQSPVFQHDNANWMTFAFDASIYLARLADDVSETGTLDGLCLKSASSGLTPGTMGPGDAIKVIDKEELSDDGQRLLLSDTTVVQRSTGEWVMYLKGIRQSDANACQTSTDGICEECKRSIFRLTSNDLQNWTGFEKVVSQVSIPEAYTDASGRIWLYYQNFEPACSAQDKQLAQRAPMSTRWEQDDYSLSDAINLVLPDEPFELDTSLHYATNPNAISLSDEAAVERYQDCVDAQSSFQ